MSQTLMLESIAGDDPVLITQIEGGGVTFGREPENAIVVDSPSVSRRHAALFEVGSSWVFRDLGSTNGSWINGVRVEADHYRLLRHGDVVQLADFPMRVLYEGVDAHTFVAPDPGSLLIFQGDRFESEFPLVSADARFVIGGEGAHLYLGGESPGELQIGYLGERLELAVSNFSYPILVNGMAVSGTTALSDRDVLEVAGFIFVVNDPRTASAPTEAQQKYVATENPKPDVPIVAFDRPNRPDHLRPKGEDGGWESEAARRRSSEGRKFVFGSEEGDFDPQGTMSLPARNFGSGEVRFEPTASQRMAGFSQPKEPQRMSPASEKLYMFLGLAVVVVMLVAAVILFV